MEKQTKTQNQVANPAGRKQYPQIKDSTELIQAMEDSVDRLRNRFQTMRTNLERLQNWLEPIESPPHIIEDPFIILSDDDEGGDPQ
jgi:hypothetical protein